MTLFLLALISCAAAYQLFALFCVVEFLREERKNGAGPCPAPPVSIIKPIKGGDSDLEANIRSFCEQRYPAFEVLLGFSDPHDKEISRLQEIATQFPCCRLVVTTTRCGANEKISNLHGLVQFASHALLAISDSDMRAQPTYLRDIVSEYFGNENTGLVTCLYKSSSPETMGAAMESLTVALDFMPAVLVARRMEGITFGLGASLLLSPEAIKEFGGLAAIGDYLADDYEIGRRVRQSGYRIILSRVLVENNLGKMSLLNHWKHQVRWARTYRASRPFGYFGYGVTHLVFFALLLPAVQGLTPLAISILCASYGLRAALSIFIHAKEIRSRRWLAWALVLLPIKDVLAFFIWAWSFAGNKVAWRNITYTIGKDGKMRREKGSPV